MGRSKPWQECHNSETLPRKRATPRYKLREDSKGQPGPVTPSLSSVLQTVQPCHNHQDLLGWKVSAGVAMLPEWQLTTAQAPAETRLGPGSYRSLGEGGCVDLCTATHRRGPQPLTYSQTASSFGRICLLLKRCLIFIIFTYMIAL